MNNRISKVFVASMLLLGVVQVDAINWERYRSIGKAISEMALNRLKPNNLILKKEGCSDAGDVLTNNEPLSLKKEKSPDTVNNQPFVLSVPQVNATNWEKCKSLDSAIAQIAFNHLKTKNLILKKERGSNTVDVLTNNQLASYLGYITFHSSLCGTRLSCRTRLKDVSYTDCNESALVESVKRLLPGAFEKLDIEAVDVALFNKDVREEARVLGFTYKDKIKDYDWQMSRKHWNLLTRLNK
jgi:hypothetical protein